MRVLNAKEFEEYCKRLPDPCYVFSTENQNGVPNTLHISLRFNKIYVTLHPNIVSFAGERSRLTMRNVKQIHIYDDVESIGVRTDIICSENQKDIVYTFLID